MRIRPSDNHRQQGAALIVGLVLLLVLTVLAVSTMRTAALELTMTGNAQFKENAFQVAEIGLENMIDIINNNILVPQTDDGWQISLPSTTINAGADTFGAHETELSYTAETQPVYCGGTLGQYTAHNYRINSDGSSSRGAASRQSQGFVICAPAGPVSGVDSL